MLPTSQSDARRRAELIEQIRPVAGWLRDAQAEMLWSSAERLAAGSTVVEIGSFHGKSTIVLATAAPADARVYAIDPHAGNDRGPGQWVGSRDDGVRDYEQFRANLERHGVADRVVHVRKYSHDAHDDVAGAIDLLYVDGAHGYSPALADITEWGGRVPTGGRMIIHDVYNSLFVSLAVMRRLWFSRSWRRIGRTTSMASYERCDLAGRAYIRNVIANVAEFPHFARNMAIKALRAAGVERAAFVFGHKVGDRLY
jgi:predicted O-methyltransferase YrrM